MIKKLNKMFHAIGKGWSKMPKGKKSYSMLWMITGAFLISLIVMFVALNSTFKAATPPPNGWTVTQNHNNVRSEETVPKESDYKVQTIDSLKVYENFDQKKQLQDFPKKYNEQAFLVKNETIGTTINNPGSYLNNYTPIVKTSGDDLSPNLKEYISPKNVRGWFDANQKFVARGPIYAVGTWNTTPTDKAKLATTITAIVGLTWAAVFTASIITTVVVSKKAKGGSK